MFFTPHNEINFSVSSFEKIIFNFVFNVFPTTATSSAILTQRSFTFLPLLSENLSQETIFIDFGDDCPNILKHVIKSYDMFWDVRDSHKQVVGLIYTKQLAS